jgi:hypothetical protein
MTSLGATTSNLFPPDEQVHDGTLRGAEYSLNFYNLYSPATVTADVVFYPKYQTLVAEDAAWSRLSADQQGIIRDAAATARQAQMATLPDDAGLIAAFCEQGDRAVLAGAANLEAFAAAAGPIVNRLRQDPFTAQAIDAITALKAATPRTPITACEPTRQPTAAPAESGPPTSLVPDGTYILVNTKPDLLAKGANAMDATNNEGTWTWRFDGDQGSWTIDHPDGFHEECIVTYTLMGDRVRMDMVEGCSDWVDFRWQLEGDQLIVRVVPWEGLSEYDAVALQAILGRPWTKVE